MENVTCTWGRLTPSACVSEVVKSVQTYCGLEIVTIAATPRASCTQRFQRSVRASPATVLRMAGAVVAAGSDIMTGGFFIDR
jgi:hypothetical protein